MLGTGKQHLESLRAGRRVHLGRELVTDVTSYPAFARAARTVTDRYDFKADPAHAAVLTYEEDGGTHSSYFPRARTRADPAFNERESRPVPTLRVIAEDDSGVRVPWQRVFVHNDVALSRGLVGSELAGRQAQSEKFSGGAGFVGRNHSFREAPRSRHHDGVDSLRGEHHAG